MTKYTTIKVRKETSKMLKLLIERPIEEQSTERASLKRGEKEGYAVLKSAYVLDVSVIN